MKKENIIYGIAIASGFIFGWSVAYLWFWAFN
jgi:hypothetical protein